jgi:predicted carbohydrate-binding protein with CBM5 and CBM33 domain
VSDDRKFELSSDSEEEAPDFDYLLKLPPSTGSHFILKSEKEKFDDTTQFSKHFVIDTNILNLAMKSIPFNERHEIGGIEWSAAEVLQMREEAENNEKAYRDALEKILFDEKRKSEKQPEKLAKKVDEMKISEEKPAKSALRTPANDKEAIQDWLDDILDM